MRWTASAATTAVSTAVRSARSSLALEDITAEAFAPFGDLVDTSGEGVSANHGTSKQHKWLTQLENLRGDAKLNVSVFDARPVTLPLEIKELERHPFSTQMFVPTTGGEYLVIVAPKKDDGSPDLEGLRAFRCKRPQRINYKPNTWHHGIVALGQDAELTAYTFENGTKDDCITFALPRPICVDG